jgi:hypothetical protein
MGHAARREKMNAYILVEIEQTRDAVKSKMRRIILKGILQ